MCQDSQHPSHSLNQVPPNYNSGVLFLEPIPPDKTFLYVFANKYVTTEYAIHT